MKIDAVNNEEHEKLQKNIIQRDVNESLAEASLTSEVLSRLNVAIDSLPQKHQQLLSDTSQTVEQSDSIVLSHESARQLARGLEEEYEIQKLRHKNKELKIQIERNNKTIEYLRLELAESKRALGNQPLNPENIQEQVRQMRQKLASYEEICAKAKAKYHKHQVPESILPKSLEELVRRLTELRVEEEELRQRADDITLARRARHTLQQLARSNTAK